jgi:hypothetical protein
MALTEKTLFRFFSRGKGERLSGRHVFISGAKVGLTWLILLKVYWCPDCPELFQLEFSLDVPDSLA